MTEMFDETPVDLAPLERDMQRRTQRLTTALARRVLRDSARNALGRWAGAAWLAAAASVAAVFIGHDQPTNDAFAAFVLPHQPAAGWVAAGRPPDLAEVLIVASGGR